MKKQTFAIILGIALLSLVSSYYAGETITEINELNTTNLVYTLSGNTTPVNLEINLTNEQINITLPTDLTPQSFDIIFIEEITKTEQIIKSRTKTVKKIVNETFYIEEVCNDTISISEEEWKKKYEETKKLSKETEKKQAELIKYLDSVAYPKEKDNTWLYVLIGLLITGVIIYWGVKNGRKQDN